VTVTTLIGNPRTGSRTRTAALRLAHRIAEETGTPHPARTGNGERAAEIDLAGFGPSLLEPGPPAPVARALDAVRGTDLLVVASPTYKATYTGLLKVFADLLPSGALGGVTAVPVLVMASPAHAFAVDAHLRPLLLELGADVPAPGLALLQDDIDADPGAPDGPAPRLDRALDAWLAEAAPALRAASRSPAP